MARRRRRGWPRRGEVDGVTRNAVDSVKLVGFVGAYLGRVLIDKIKERPPCGWSMQAEQFQHCKRRLWRWKRVGNFQVRTQLAGAGSGQICYGRAKMLSERAMPIKDLTGPPLPTAEEKALLTRALKRLGMPLPKRPGFRDDGGLEPAPYPAGPKPTPLAGGAGAVLD